MQKWFWWVVVVVVALMFGIFLLGQDDSSSGGLVKYDPDTVQLQDHIWGFDPTGKTEADLTAFIAGRAIFVEYADFQCPGCVYFALSTLQAAKNEYGDRVVFIYRHYPLPSIHPYIMAAHRAAEAAANQGKFWEMHDLLFERVDSWSQNNNPAGVIESYALELGLDLERYRFDVADAATYNRIDNDMESSSKYRISGTPTFILNGEDIGSTIYYEQLQPVLDEVLAQLSTE